MDSPDCDKALFDVNIEALYKEAIAALEYHRYDDIQETAMCSYVNAMVDLYKEDNFPNSQITEVDEIADLLDEMWQRTSCLVEDTLFRRTFILICTNVLMVITWEDGQDEVTPELIASFGVKL